MAVSRAMRRLLRIRNLEEEQSRLALEAKVSELRRLEHALSYSVERKRMGRGLVLASARTNQLPDRLAGMEEMRSATSHAEALVPHIERKQEEVAERRQAFLEKRIERRQAETLIEEGEAREVIDEGRRGQQALDNWFSSKQYRDALGAESGGRQESDGGEES
jgi:hypothetical protein